MTAPWCCSRHKTPPFASGWCHHRDVRSSTGVAGSRRWHDPPTPTSPPATPHTPHRGAVVNVIDGTDRITKPRVVCDGGGMGAHIPTVSPSVIGSRRNSLTGHYSAQWLANSSSVASLPSRANTLPSAGGRGKTLPGNVPLSTLTPKPSAQSTVDSRWPTPRSEGSRDRQNSTTSCHRRRR